MMNRVVLGATVAAAIAVGSAASGSTLSLAFNTTGYGASGAGITYNNGSINYSYNGFAGQLKWNGFGAQSGKQYTTYCTELGESTGSWTYTEVALEQVPDNVPPPQNDPNGAGPMGVTKAALMRDLYARYVSTLGTDGNKNAAFQLCVWEISHENVTLTDLNLAKGQLSLSGGWLSSSNSSLASAANLMLGGLGTDGWMSYGLEGLTNDAGQDQILIVPIPASALLAGIGLLGAVAARRRFANV